MVERIGVEPIRKMVNVKTADKCQITEFYEECKKVAGYYIKLSSFIIQFQDFKWKFSTCEDHSAL